MNVTGLALLASIGALGIFIQQIRLERARRERDVMRSRCEDAAKVVAESLARRTRLELDVTLLRHEIQRLEEELATCTIPELVRARLRRILQESAGRATGEPAVPAPTGIGTSPSNHH